MCAWWGFQDFPEVEGGQGQTEQGKLPRAVGPWGLGITAWALIWPYPDEDAGTLGWHHLETPSHRCVKNICLMFIGWETEDWVCKACRTEGGRTHGLYHLYNFTLPKPIHPTQQTQASQSAISLFGDDQLWLFMPFRNLRVYWKCPSFVLINTDLFTLYCF